MLKKASRLILAAKEGGTRNSTGSCRRSKKGMTLSELLVALGILSLIGVVMVYGLATASAVYVNTTTTANSETLCVTLLKAVQKEIRNCNAINLDGDPITFESDTYGVNVSVGADSQDRVTIGGTEILSPGSYPNGIKAQCSLSKEGSDTVRITVKTGLDLLAPSMEESLVVKPAILE